MACSGESWTTPPMSKTTPAIRATASAGGGAEGGGGERRRGHLAQRHRHAERAQPVHALQLFQLEVLGLTADVTQVAQVLEVTAVLRGLGGVAVHDGELAGLGHALRGALDEGLVDPLPHDLVADVVGAVNVE